MARRSRAPHHVATGGTLAEDWDDGLSVGVEALDVHHRQVWRRVRHLAQAVSDGGAEEVRAALRLLHAHLQVHYRDEERWIADAGYPGAREHVRLHAAVLERLRLLREGDGAAADAALVAGAAALVEALDAHMRVDDLKLGRFWTARQNLRRLAESGPGVGVALTPIPAMSAPARASFVRATTPPPAAAAPPARRARPADGDEDP
jgi:hemerythrin-like metal-binding protein